MSPGWIVALEFGAVTVGVSGFGLWELWRLRRDRRAPGAGSTAPHHEARVSPQAEPVSPDAR